jgi:rubrerythrin
MRVSNPLANRRPSRARRARRVEGRSAERLAAERRSDERLAADRREQLVRESGGPQDTAVYACPCGYQFSASVDTAVVCPNCGAEQAW